MTNNIFKVKTFLFVLILLWVLMPVTSYGNGRAIFEVYVNTVNKGEYFLSNPNNGSKFFMSTEDLKELGLVSLRVLREEGEEVLLDSLYPQVKYLIDKKKLAIYLAVDPLYLEKNMMDLGLKRGPKGDYIENTTAYVTYAANYTLDQNEDFSSVSLPFEAAISHKGALVKSNFLYSGADDALGDYQDDTVRLLSSVTVDDKKNLRRFVLGDFIVSSGSFGSGGNYGGISISKNYSLNPFFNKTESVSLSGIAEMPSEADIYVNGQLVRTVQLKPGEFELSSIPNTETGSGEATVVLKDAFGEVMTMTRDFYNSPRILKRGISEYSYNLGTRREFFGIENNEYDDELVFSAFHRLGITGTLTAGFKADASTDVVNGAAELVVPVLNKSELALTAFGNKYTGPALPVASLTTTDEDYETGSGGTLSFRMNIRPFSMSYTARGFSRYYSNLNIGPLDDKPRFIGNASAGLVIRKLGSLTASYIKTHMYESPDWERASLRYSRSFLNRFVFSARASRTEREGVIDPEDEIYFTVTFSPVKYGIYGGSWHTHQETVETTSVYVAKNTPWGRGFGFRGEATESRTDTGVTTTSTMADVTYKTKYANLSANHRRSSQVDSYRYSLSGSVAFIGGGAYLTRPIRDGFALINLGEGVKGVMVKHNNQPAGKTNGKGKALVPDMVSYGENLLSIDDSDLPIEYELPQLSRYVSTPYRGGSVVFFEAMKTRAVTGKFFLKKKNGKEPVQYWSINAKANGGYETDSVVGRNGVFYVENIPSGPLTLKFTDGKSTCNYDLTVPDGDDMIENVGDIICEIK